MDALEGAEMRIVGWPGVDLVMNAIKDTSMSKATAIQFVESYNRFYGLSKDLFIEMINLYGFETVLHLWLFMHSPCCRVTYQPILNSSINQVFASNYYLEYAQSCEACIMFPHYMELMLRRHAIMMDMFMPRSTVMSDGSSAVLSINEKLGSLMYSPNPFSSNFAYETGIMITETVPGDDNIVQSERNMIMLNEHLFAWRDPVWVLFYENRVSVAESYSKYAQACEIITADDVEPFVEFIRNASFEKIMWLQHGIVDSPYNE